MSLSEAADSLLAFLSICLRSSLGRTFLTVRL